MVVFGRRGFGASLAMFGTMLLLTGLLAVPALGQQNTGGIQYDDDEAICQAVINLVLNTVQNNENNGNDQYVNDISQELNISPSIVQECVEDGLEEANSGDQYDQGVEITNIINVPDKDLPETGGPPLLGILFSVVAGAGLLTAVIRRRY